MSDQYKPSHRDNHLFDASPPYFPQKFYEDFNKAYNAWEIRRGLATENSFKNRLRGSSLRANNARKNQKICLEKKATKTKKTSKKGLHPV